MTMMGHSAKRRKTTANESAGVPAIDSLPPELRDTICGFLDVRTLCTVRLVCKKFRAAASRCIHSVSLSIQTLRSRPETTLHNFPNLSRVSLFDVKEDDLLMLARSPVGAAVTHLRAVQFPRPVPQRTRNAPGLTLLPLPNLTSLTVGDWPDNRAFPFPQTLRELSLSHAFQPAASRRAANLVTRLTNLTCLQIDVSDHRGPFQALTALTALERLEICTQEWADVPLVAKLTLLTHLQIRVVGRADFSPELSPLASLARLDRLVHLGVKNLGDSGQERQLLAGISAMTSLRSLDLELPTRPDRSAFETVCMTPFSQLTALRLEISGLLVAGRLDASFLPRFNLEKLQELSLSAGVHLDGEGVAALRRATGLTRLQLCDTTGGGRAGLDELGIALSHMPRLRALSLDTRHMSEPTTCFGAVGLLTELTSLSWKGDKVSTSAVVEACLGLKKLRALEILPANPRRAPHLTSEAVTPEMLLKVAMLPELSTFTVSSNFRGVGWNWYDFKDHVRAQHSTDRHDRGWAPLKLGLIVG